MDFPSENNMYFPNAGDDNIIQQDTEDPNAIKIPSYNAGSVALLQFFMALFDMCSIYCAEVVAGVDWELIKDKIEDIYNQIWFISGLKPCPQYMLDDNGRLMKLCQLFVPNKVKEFIDLNTEEFVTIKFVMACMRKQSTKGRRKLDPNVPKEALKEMLERKQRELTAEDIKDRMTRLLPYNISQYYSLEVDKETGCAKIGPKDKSQSFKDLDQEEVFKAFMEKGKRTSSGSRKRKREETQDQDEKPDLNDHSQSTEKRPRKIRCVKEGVTFQQANEIVHASQTDPTARKERYEGEEWFDQLLRGHIEEIQGANRAQYFRCTGRLLGALQDGLKARGMSVSEAKELIADPSLLNDPRFASRLQPLRQDYYAAPQYRPQFNAAQYVSGPYHSYATVPQHEYSAYMTPLYTTSYNMYEDQQSPVTDMFLGGVHDATEEIEGQYETNSSQAESYAFHSQGQLSPAEHVTEEMAGADVPGWDMYFNDQDCGTLAPSLIDSATRVPVVNGSC